MKTKALLLAAAICAVAAGTSKAQVYSANAVGYVNMTLNPGFSLIANPLDNTNNSLSVILPNVPVQTRVYRFEPVPATYTIATKTPIGGGSWNTNMVMEPGQGFFISIPAGAPVTVTFVGEVPQGNLSNPLAPGRFQIVSSQVPQALPLGRPNSAVGVQTLGFPAAVGDRVYTFNGTYTTHTFVQLGANPPFWNTAGSQDGPTIGVGQSFFLSRAATGSSAWTRTFSVN
jgi:hypothetical protein